jgi:cyclophilin family peptidyl-prolyl cis-trans isomerase
VSKSSIRRSRRSIAIINSALEQLETRTLFAAPVLDAIADQTIPSGRTLQVPLTATDADGDPITYTFSTNNGSITTKLHASTNQFVKMNVTGSGFSGSMTFQLFNDVTPITAGNIAGLVESGFYNNLTFHRIIKGFVAQGGDPLGNGQGGPGFEYQDEINKDLIYSGDAQLAMARTDRDTNGSQIFITDGPQRGSLDYQYTLFGQLVRGRSTLTSMLNTPVTGDTPNSKPKITSASVISDTTDAVVQLTAGSGTGATTVTVTATDSHGQTSQRTFTVTRVADTQNDPPFLGPVGDQTVAKNGTLKVTLHGTDVDGETISYATAVVDANGNNSTNATATISGNVLTVTPKKDFTGAVYVIVGATDPHFVTQNSQGQTISNFDKETIRVGVGDKPATNGTPQTLDFAAKVGTSGVVLATFKDSDSAATAADWKVVPESFTANGESLKRNGVYWGDKTFTSATVVKNSDGTFSVVAAHTYANVGTYPVRITLEDKLGARMVINSTAVVHPSAQQIGSNVFVNGTTSKDTINITLSGGMIHAVVDGVDKTFTASGVTRVLAFAFDGDDRITIGAGVPATYISGGSGNDQLKGGDSNDTLSGGAGKDSCYGNNGNDRLNGNGSSDYLVGGPGNDRMYGGSGDDRLDGGAGVDREFGDDGNDFISGGASNDHLFGLIGNDTLVGNKGADFADGGLGTDTDYKESIDPTPISIEVLKAG